MTEEWVLILQKFFVEKINPKNDKKIMRDLDESYQSPVSRFVIYLLNHSYIYIFSLFFELSYLDDL